MPTGSVYQDRRGSEVVGPVYAFLHHPQVFAGRSGMGALAEKLGATPVYYDIAWEKLQEKSWTLGHWMRRAGVRFYGSTWNAAVPVWDEMRFLGALRDTPCIAHFLWGEFASPKWPGLYRRKGAAVVGTFHCSARRLPEVLGGVRSFDGFDAITLMSESQRGYFVARGYPPERLHVILHGVDTDFFTPAGREGRRGEGELRLLLVGSTERDHVLAAEVMRRLKAEPVRLYLRTSDEYLGQYGGLPNVTVLPRLDDEGLREEYRRADLLFMPMLDCTANNAILEAMACGTPVMANRVGGIPEYADPSSCFIMDGSDPEAWTGRLAMLARDREELLRRRSPARQWAERFDWALVAPAYLDVYRKVGRGGPPATLRVAMRTGPPRRIARPCDLVRAVDSTA
jgi:glycosyltransferase involved in cell wall biosynthesis